MTAQIFQNLCIGCGDCIIVCPHQIIELDDSKKAFITNEKRCIECGACALQCPVFAILTHQMGCGCVSGVVKKRIRKLLGLKQPKNCC